MSAVVNFLVCYGIGCLIPQQLGSEVDWVAAPLLLILEVSGSNPYPLTEVTVLIFRHLQTFGILSKFLGAFAKFRKVTSFVTCVCVCVCVCVSVRMEQLGSHWTAFHEI